MNITTLYRPFKRRMFFVCCILFSTHGYGALVVHQKAGQLTLPIDHEKKKQEKNFWDLSNPYARRGFPSQFCAITTKKRLNAQLEGQHYSAEAEHATLLTLLMSDNVISSYAYSKEQMKDIQEFLETKLIKDVAHTLLSYFDRQLRSITFPKLNSALYIIGEALSLPDINVADLDHQNISDNMLISYRRNLVSYLNEYSLYLVSNEETMQGTYPLFFERSAYARFQQKLLSEEALQIGKDSKVALLYLYNSLKFLNSPQVQAVMLCAQAMQQPNRQ